MDGVDFAMAAVALPAFCFGTMQNVSSEEQTVARAQCDIIAKTELSNVLKCNLLGLLLVNLVGKAVLERAVRALGDEIRAPLDGFDFERAAVALPAYCFATAQNVTAEVQKAAVAQIELLRATDLSNALKCKLLGLTLIEIVGRPAVERAIRTLGAEIRVP
jgi:preprotein translocase subunit Sss1